jgi:hypothetical protein
MDNELYGNLEDGYPEKDTLTDITNEKGNIIGIGRMAIHEKNISDLKIGNWKEYDESGILISEGNYKIGSFLDCCMGGVCKSFYSYRDGAWKYYSKNGDLKYELNFTPTKLKVDTRCEGGDELIFGLIKDIPLKYINELNADKLYELQKISIKDNDYEMTFIPLNDKLIIEYKFNL